MLLLLRLRLCLSLDLCILLVLVCLRLFAVIVVKSKLAVDLALLKESSKLEDHAAHCLADDLVDLHLIMLYVPDLVTNQLYVGSEKQLHVVYVVLLQHFILKNNIKFL